MFRQRHKASKTVNWTDVFRSLVIPILAVGLVAIAFADKDYRSLFVSLASSIISAQLAVNLHDQASRNQ